MSALRAFDFASPFDTDLLVCAGGFEDRSIALARRLSEPHASSERRVGRCLVVHYTGREECDNKANYERLLETLGTLPVSALDAVDIEVSRPLRALWILRRRIAQISRELRSGRATVDISGMTHLLAVGAIHACQASGLVTDVVYTEAEQYFPVFGEQDDLLRYWSERNYSKAAELLQSGALRAVHVEPEFAGNFRPGRRSCLMVFAGYEPLRLQGLVEQYRPGGLVVLYGVSPYLKFRWRTELSRRLHRDLFARYPLREVEVSTLLVDEVLERLETEFNVVRHEFDVAVTPLCSKMQGVAAYLLWRRHPEVQLLFTSPVRFNPSHYSQGEGKTHIYSIR